MFQNPLRLKNSKKHFVLNHLKIFLNLKAFWKNQFFYAKDVVAKYSIISNKIKDMLINKNYLNIFKKMNI